MAADQLEATLGIVVEKICVGRDFRNQIVVYPNFDPVLTPLFLPESQLVEFQEHQRTLWVGLKETPFCVTSTEENKRYNGKDSRINISSNNI